PVAQIAAVTRGVIQAELVRMWSASRNTVFMVTHDVDEAILLSDRIALMTKGPNARLAEIIPVKIPRPRTRAELIDDPEYLRLRNHILHFLVEAAQRPAAAEVAITARPGRLPPRATQTREPAEDDGPTHRTRDDPSRSQQPRHQLRRSREEDRHQGRDLPGGGAARSASAERRRGQEARRDPRRERRSGVR